MRVVEEQGRQLADTGADVSISGGQSVPLVRGPVATVHFTARGALKVYPAKFDRKTVAAVEREQNILRGLSADAPILAADAVEKLDDGRHALRMPLCAQSLTALVREVGTVPAQDVVVLGYALALALATAHNAGILHGGVSPDNVLFHTSGEPVLADFGVPLREAFPRDPLHAIEYVAPEVLRTGVVDERTDLYSLGAVLHYALTGQTPHPGRLGEQPSDRVLRVLRSPVPAISRPDVPLELSTVVGRLLAPEPAHRPPDAAWVTERLAAMLPAPDPVAQPPVTSGAPVRPAAAPAVDQASEVALAAAPTIHPTMPPVGASPKPAAPKPTAPKPAAPERRRRGPVIAGTAVAGAGLAAVLVVLFTRGDSDELFTTPVQPPPPVSAPASTLAPGGATGARVDLADPVDLGTGVQLTWNSDQVLDYAVIVAGEGEPNHTILAQRNHTLTVPIDPIRKYCFLVQGTDGNQVYQTAPKPIRGAVCHP